MKRAGSPDLLENPFIKRQNNNWEIEVPYSLQARVSPPPSGKKTLRLAAKGLPLSSPKTAAVEAGSVEIEDHASFFSKKLLESTCPSVAGVARLSHQDWLDLYQRNQHVHGHHFVIHQHDHPVAGTHYDLRLQCNGSSSISFAIMYGLPGDPNSRRLNRNATETRVHNIWVGILND